MEPALHPDLASLAFLLGAWEGEGDGEWPRGEPFRYGETVSFEHVGDPFLVYTQRSWHLDDGTPLHLERGFLRPAGAGRVELVLANPLGVAEIAEGTLDGRVIDVASTTVAVTRTGSPVTDLRRRIEVGEDTLTYELHMAMRDIALISHVRSRLARV
ncbi:MAG TPA: FABP family protein [Actinomycetota bacterium]